MRIGPGQFNLYFNREVEMETDTQAEREFGLERVSGYAQEVKDRGHTVLSQVRRTVDRLVGPDTEPKEDSLGKTPEKPCGVMGEITYQLDHILNTFEQMDKQLDRL